jgi:hypothetical protein
MTFARSEVCDVHCALRTKPVILHRREGARLSWTLGKYMGGIVLNLGRFNCCVRGLPLRPGM